MPGSVPFTDNYRDLSNINGFQFEFHCERCGNGYRSAYQRDAISTGQGILRSVSGMFGGALGSISNAASEFTLNRGTNSGAKDRALAQAVEEISGRFEQCRGCGQWVCGEVCWNGEVGQCAQCSPVVADEVAQLQAQVRRDQIRTSLEGTNLVAGISLERQSVPQCPSCGARSGGGKFCSDCGTSLAARSVCRSCGTENSRTARFCGECGTAVV